MANETIKLEFKGRIRELRFGIGPTRILCEELDIQPSEMKDLDFNTFIQDIISASLKYDCLLTGVPIDFTKWEVYQWITDMEQETFQQIFDIFLKTRIIGKSIYDRYIKELDKNAGQTTDSLDEKKNSLGTI